MEGENSAPNAPSGHNSGGGSSTSTSFELLLDHIMQHNVAEVERIIQEENIHMVQQNDDIETIFPLLLATLVGEPQIIKLLLQAGCDVNQSLAGPAFYLSRWPTALHQAVKSRNAEVVETLVNFSNCDLNVTNCDRETALHIAVEEGLCDITQILINKGCDANLVDCRGNSVLHVALSSNLFNEELFRLLIGSGINIDTINGRNLTPIKYAAMLGNMSAVRMLLHAGCQLAFHEGYISPVEAAILDNKTEKLALLLERFGERTDESLHFASRYGNQEQMALLLRYKLHVIDEFNCQGETPLIVACRYRNMETLVCLLEYGASPSAPSSYDITPLCKATLDNNLSIVKVLIRYGANVDMGLDINSAAVHKALFCGFYNIAKLLLQVGCTLNPSALHLVLSNHDWVLLPVVYAAGYIGFAHRLALRFERHPQWVEQCLAKWLQHIAHNPPLLQHICRTALRRKYRTKISVFIEKVNLPTPLKDYIMMKSDKFPSIFVQ